VNFDIHFIKSKEAKLKRHIIFITGIDLYQFQ